MRTIWSVLSVSQAFHAYLCASVQVSTGKEPYLHHTSLFQLQDAVVAGERPALSSPIFHEAPAGYGSLLAKCWHAHAEQRPSIQVVREELEGMLHTLPAGCTTDDSECKSRGNEN